MKAEVSRTRFAPIGGLMLSSGAIMCAAGAIIEIGWIINYGIAFMVGGVLFLFQLFPEVLNYAVGKDAPPRAPRVAAIVSAAMAPLVVVLVLHILRIIITSK